MLWECESSESVLSVNKRRNQLGGGGRGEGERGGEGQKENGEVRSHSIPSTRLKCTPKTPTLQGNNRV